MSQTFTITRWGQFTNWFKKRMMNWGANKGVGLVPTPSTGSPTGGWYLALSNKAAVEWNELITQSTAGELAPSTYSETTRYALTLSDARNGVEERVFWGNSNSPQFVFAGLQDVTVAYMIDTASGTGNIACYWKFETTQSPAIGQPFTPPIDGLLQNMK